MPPCVGRPPEKGGIRIKYKLVFTDHELTERSEFYLRLNGFVDYEFEKGTDLLIIKDVNHAFWAEQLVKGLKTVSLLAA